MPSTHVSLLKLMMALNYDVTPVGLCHGVTMRWEEAFFLNEESLFRQRITNALTYPYTLPEDLPAFFESLLLYQQPNEFEALFTEYVPQQRTDQVSLIAASDIMREQGGIHTLGMFLSICDPLHLKSLHDQLGILQRSTERVGCLLSNTCHVIGCGYDPSTQKWSLMDIEQWPPKVYDSLDEMLSDAYKGLYQGDSAVIHGRYIAPVSAKIQLEMLPIDLSTATSEQKVACLALAITNEDENTIDYLCQLSGSHDFINTLVGTTSELIKTPLTIALSMYNLELCMKLIQQGCLWGGCEIEYLQFASLGWHYRGHYRDMLPEVLNLPDAQGKTLLMSSIENRRFNFAQKLISIGANIQHQDSQGDNMLFYAVKTGDEGLCKQLFEAGVSMTHANTDGVTPLMLAAQANNTSLIVDTIRPSIYDINAKDNKDRSAIWYAVVYDSRAAAKLLLRKGSDVRITSTLSQREVQRFSDAGITVSTNKTYTLDEISKLRGMTLILKNTQRETKEKLQALRDDNSPSILPKNN